MTHKPNTTIKISVDELEQFALLLDSGLDNKTMIEITFKDHEKIVQALQQGISLLDILSSQKGKTFETIQLLSKYLSLKETIQSIHTLSNSTSSLFKKLVKNALYPCFMFLFSYFMILFFSHVLLPAMKEYTDINSFLIMYILEFSFSFLLISLLILFLFRKRFFSKLSIVKKISTIRFAILLESLLTISLPTSQALELLSQYKSIQDISLPIYENLQKGKTLLEILKTIPVMDSSFIPLFQIGLETDTTKLLHIYIEKTSYILSKDIKKISIIIQIIAYLSVGLMVLLIYQIMLMPLNMLNSM